MGRIVGLALGAVICRRGGFFCRPKTFRLDANFSRVQKWSAFHQTFARAAGIG
jgi:hypothetical protein